MVDKGRLTVRRSKEVEAAKTLWDVLRLFLFPVPNEHCRKSQIHRSPSPLSPRSSFASSSRGSCRKYSSNSRFVRNHDERFHYLLWNIVYLRKEFSIFPLSFVRSANLIDDNLLNRSYFAPFSREEILFSKSKLSQMLFNYVSNDIGLEKFLSIINS